MAGESNNEELKITFDPGNPGSVVELVKDLVAFANSGGGTIQVGRTETSQDGIPESMLGLLDGARICDQVNRYISPCKASVSHNVIPVARDRFVVDLSICSCGRYPYVFSKQGEYPTAKHQKAAFREGDIYVRHGAKSERATYQSIVDIIDKAVAQAVASSRDEIMRRIDQLVRLPEGYVPVFETPAGRLESPETLLDWIAARRKHHSGALLDGSELLWCFTQRHGFDLTTERRQTLVRSALRRTPTLYFWLSEDLSGGELEQILVSSLEDADRDRSDASDAILEVAALIASDSCLDSIVSAMSESKYRHFRDAAARWKGRAQALRVFSARISNATVDGDRVADLSLDQVYSAADRLALEMLATPGPLVRLSRMLGDLGRVVYFRKLELDRGIVEQGI